MTPAHPTSGPPQQGAALILVLFGLAMVSLMFNPFVTNHGDLTDTASLTLLARLQGYWAQRGVMDYGLARLRWPADSLGDQDGDGGCLDGVDVVNCLTDNDKLLFLQNALDQMETMTNPDGETALTRESARTHRWDYPEIGSRYHFSTTLDTLVDNTEFDHLNSDDSDDGRLRLVLTLAAPSTTVHDRIRNLVNENPTLLVDFCVGSQAAALRTTPGSHCEDDGNPGQTDTIISIERFLHLPK